MSLSRISIAGIALGIGIVWVIFIPNLGLPDFLNKLLFDYSASYYPFTIQNIMWIMFFVGLGELFFRFQAIAAYRGALKANYLPEDSQIMLTPEDMSSIYRKLKTEKNDLANVIKSLALRFQAGRSVGETHEMLNSQLELWQYQLDISYSMIRYITWLIPTLGFIGTVVGIAQTLNFASTVNPDDPALLTALTEKLGLAFDTTLIALIMSAVLVFIMHVIQSREEKSIARSGEYCLNHLITRLYLS